MTEPMALHRFPRALITLGVTVAAIATAVAQPPAAIRTSDNAIEFGHKSWMLPRLRERTDIVVLDSWPFLDAAGVPR